MAETFPLIKLAKKLKVNGFYAIQRRDRLFPLIKLAKKLKEKITSPKNGQELKVSIN